MRILRGALTATILLGAIALIPVLPADAADGGSISVPSADVGFGRGYVNAELPPKTVTVTSDGTAPVVLGVPSIDSATPGVFRIVQSTCTSVTLAVGQQCEITVAARPSAETTQYASLTIPNDALDNFWLTLSVQGFVTPRDTFYPITPQRVVDTRSGLGAPRGKVAPGKTIDVYPGIGTIGDNPALVLNVTVTGPTANGILTVYPAGAARPNTSSLNYTTGWTGANSVTVGAGPGGHVKIYNAGGATHVIVDILGFYLDSDDFTLGGGYIGGAYHPVTPIRLADTRSGGKLPADHYFNVAASWDPSIDPHVKAFAVNITAVNPSAAGFLTAWEGVTLLPHVSNLNYTAGRTVPNMAIVPTAPCDDCGEAEGWPSIAVYSSAASHVLVDLVGVFDDSTLTGGLRFRAITPRRIVDTRGGLGIPAALGANRTATVTPPAAVAPADTGALALNVTAVTPTANTFLTVWPSDRPRPFVSNLNPTAGRNVPNAVITGLGTADAFNVYNSVGSTHVLVDVVGRFWVYPGTAGAGSPVTRSAGPAAAEVYSGSPRRAP